MSETERHPLITRLLELDEADDLAAFARLRRGLRKQPGEVAELLQYVVPYVFDRDPRDEECFYAVASLFALHRCQTGFAMGEVFRRLSAGKEDSIRRRFEALLESHRDDLLRFHLPSAVRLAKSENVPIDYDQLLRDVRAWDRPRRFVQLRWAKQFWGRGSAPTQPTGPDQDTPTSTSDTE